MSDVADQPEKRENTDQTAALEQTGPIIAHAGRYYRNMRYLMFVLFIGMGAWFGYDGWVGWPRMNQKILELKNELATLPLGDPRIKQLNDQLKTLNNGEL